MGAPEWAKHRSGHSTSDNSTPGSFWTQFVIFALIGTAAAYAAIVWKKCLPLFVSVEERDQKYLAAIGPDAARKIQRGRKAYLLFSGVVMAALLGLLVTVLISS